MLQRGGRVGEVLPFLLGLASGTGQRYKKQAERVGQES